MDETSISTDPKIFLELLFGFYQDKLVDTYEPYINATNSRRLTIDDRTFFETPGSDQRAIFLNRNFMQKYSYNVSAEKDKVIPNIRISEAILHRRRMPLQDRYGRGCREPDGRAHSRKYETPALSGDMTEGRILGGPDLRIPQGVHRRRTAYLLLQAHQSSDHLLRRQLRPQGQTLPAGSRQRKRNLTDETHDSRHDEKDDSHTCSCSLAVCDGLRQIGDSRSDRPAAHLHLLPGRRQPGFQFLVRLHARGERPDRRADQIRRPAADRRPRLCRESLSR